MRKRRPADHWARIVADRRQGETWSSLAARHGVAYKSLLGWRDRLGKPGRRPAPATTLLPVHVAPPLGGGQAEPFVVRLPNGYEVAIPARFEATAVKRLLEALAS